MKAKIWNHSEWISEIRPEVLKPQFEAMLNKAGFNVLNFVEWRFEPYGYTALWLLGESHFAVHTFPECNATYIELSSCNYEYYVAMLDLIYVSYD